MTAPAPPAVRRAAVLVAAEGVVGVVAAVVFVVRGLAGADQHVVSGFGNAAWFALIGGAVLAAGWALWTGRRWGRGLAVFAQLLLLPVTWYAAVGSHQWFYGIPMAVVALFILGLLFSPSAVRWIGPATIVEERANWVGPATIVEERANVGAVQDSSASADNSEPDTR